MTLGPCWLAFLGWVALSVLSVGCTDNDTSSPVTGTGAVTGTGTGTDTGTGAATGTGGSTGAQPTQLLSGKSVHAERAAPILGGTLLVTRDGATAVAADPDRDRVFFVDLHSLAVTELELSAGDEPGRVLEGPLGRVFVFTRRTGSLVAIDVASRTVAFRAPLCRAPRGMDYDAARERVLVACRSGLVLTLSANTGEELSRVQFDDDLNDVLLRGNELVLTRGRSAEVLVASEGGTILRRRAPIDSGPSHLFRSLLLPSGEVLLAHQVGFADDVGLSYGRFGNACVGSIVAPVLSLTSTEPPASSVRPPLPSDPRDQMTAASMSFASLTLGGVLGPMDIALSPGAGKFALLSLGNAWNLLSPGPTLIVGPLDAKTNSLSPGFSEALASCAGSLAKPVSGEPVAVALDPRGRVYVQSREPAALVLDNGVSVRLSELSRADTGLALFYMNAGGNVACASCHPEGHDDGMMWLGAAGDLRRTQSLAGGVSTRAPYHWAGELSSFPRLIDELWRSRMAGLLSPTEAQTDTLLAWLDQVPAPQVVEALDAEAVERGRALFEGEGACSQCHSGPDFSDHQVHDVGISLAMQTPSLLDVAARPPYFHDGCAVTLLDALGACGGELHGRKLPADAKADLVEYLRSL
jgi:hypothetical protein